MGVKSPLSGARTPAWAIASVAMATWSCTGTITDNGAAPGEPSRSSHVASDDPMSVGPAAPGTGANDGDGGSSSVGIGGSGPTAPGSSGAGPGVDRCLDAVFQSSAAPLRRLTEREYRNTVATLFPGVALPGFEVVPDDRNAGFTNQAAGQPGSALAVEQYEKSAATIGKVAVANIDDWASCTDDTRGCATEVTLALAQSAYRRPLDADETDRTTAFAEDAFTQHGFAGAVEMAIEALLQSPFFLYRPEFGAAAAVGSSSVSLTAYEMASRLSYFFVENMPDAELMKAAETGALSSDAGIRAQAERLLAEPRARPVVTNFFAEWLRLYKLDDLSLDPNAFPEFSEPLRRDLRESARLYVEKALWEDDSWESLLTGSYGFVNDRLAPIFGVDPPGSDDLVYVELDPNERRGVLTQPGLLASTSHGIRHSPILRGVTMLTNILCTPPPAPPPGILDNLGEVELEPGAVCTTRDEVTKTHTLGEDCQVCHKAIDGAGFAFENYDALGRYRTEENGCAVDATGAFPRTDLGDSVDGAIELAARLAVSETVAACMSEHLFRFALGRSETRSDECEIASLASKLGSTGGSLQGLVLEMVLTPSFRSRPGDT